MEYRDKLHKNTQFLTNPLRVALFAAGLVLLNHPAVTLAAASTIEAGSGGGDKAGIHLWNNEGDR
jgi:hypothetical protein